MKINMFLTDKNKLTIQKGTDFLLVSAIVIFFVFLFWGINIINSGYHIIDDHEIYYFPSVINKDTIIQYFSDFILNDGRFRPLYWIHRILLFYIFKQNFTLYYSEMFILGIISSLCLFFTLKSISKNSIVSFLLLAFLFLGNTLSIFEGLGYGELFGLTFLSAALFLMTVKNNKFCEILSLIFLILCMFSKEQFLLSFPFVILFKIFFDDDNILKSLKKNTVYILISAIFFIIIFACNLYFAGKDNSSPYFIDIYNILDCIKNICQINYIKNIIYENSIFILIITLGLFFTNDNKHEKCRIIFVLTAGMFFIISHIIFLSLLSNNSLQYRYLIPAILGPVISIACVLKYFYSKNKTAYILIIVTVLISTVENYKIYPLSYIKYNAENNITFNNYLNLSKEKIKKSDNILLIGSTVETMEFFESLTRYYNYYGYNNIYIFPCIKNKVSDLNNFEKNLYNFLLRRYHNMFLKDMKKSAALILVFEYDDSVKKENMQKSKIKFNNFYNKLNNDEDDLPVDFYIENIIKEVYVR